MIQAAAARATRPLGPARTAAGRALRRVGPLRLAGVLVVACALGAGWLWLRDSSLVAIRQVTVTGITGSGSGRIRSALVAAAHSMTTLDLQVSRLRTAVAPYPSVKTLKVATDFPHGLRIHVVEELPAAVLSAAGRRVVVAADGAVLRGRTPSAALPVIAVRTLPVGPRVTAPVKRQELAVLAAAPPRLRAHISQLLDTAAHGVVVKLRAGPSLYFGPSASIRAKWIAAMAVLGNAGSAGAAYIDLSDPSRPAAW